MPTTNQHYTIVGFEFGTTEEWVNAYHKISSSLSEICTTHHKDVCCRCARVEGKLTVVIFAVGEVNGEIGDKVKEACASGESVILPEFVGFTILCQRQDKLSGVNIDRVRLEKTA